MRAGTARAGSKPARSTCRAIRVRWACFVGSTRVFEQAGFMPAATRKADRPLILRLEL